LTLPRRRRTLPCAQNLPIFRVALLAFLAGCATVPVQPLPTEAPTQRWERAQMLDALAQRREQFQSLRALARVNYSGPDGKNGFQEAVLVVRPDRLRLETLSMLGAILIVTVNSKEIVGYHPREGLYVHGQRSRANLQKYTQIPLELDEITALLLGLPPVDPRAPAQQDGNALVFASASGRKDRVSFESNQPVPTKWERLDGRGQIELSATFTDHIQTPAGPFPSKIVIDSPQQKKRLEIRYQEPELNASIAADLFSQQKPPNVKELPIEAIGS
jgi:hypothetical protein